MKVEYVNPFIQATVVTYKTMLNIDVEAGAPFLKSNDKATYDISGVIGLSGEAQGSIVLSFPKVIALKFVSLMLGTEIKIVGPELSDAIGEIANIIAGNAKQHLTQFKLSISLPNVIIGQSHKIASQTGVPTIVVPFRNSVGDFAMDVCLKTAK